MARDISVSIAVDGEKEFAQALKDAQSAVKVLDSELKASQAAYKNNGDAQQYLANKQRLLNDQLEQQRIIAQKLADAVNDSAQEFGEATREADRYRIAYNNARETLEKMEKELKDTDREMEELGRDSMRVGRQLEQGIGDGAQEAGRGLGDMTELIDSVKQLTALSGIAVGIEVIGKTVDMAGNIMDGITGIIEGSEEFNRQMSYINQNAKEAGISTETVGKYLAFATSAIGEFDQAAEGMNNLMGAKLNAAELADAMNLLIGAVIDIPETFTFPAIAEGLRQTLEEKQAVGQFADLLSYLNVEIETFDEAMSKTSSLESAQDVLLGFISNRGLEETLHGWAADNQDMIDAKTAAFDLSVALGNLATTMLPLHTEWEEMNAAAVSAVQTLLDNTDADEWVTARIENIKKIIEESEEIYKKWFTPEGRKERAEEYAETQQLLKDLEDPEFREKWVMEQQAQQAGEKIAELESKIAEAKSDLEAIENQIKAREGDTEGVLMLEYQAEAIKGKIQGWEEELKTLETAGTETGTETIDNLIAAITQKTPEAERALGLFKDAINNQFAGITPPDLAGYVADQVYAVESLLNRRPVYAYGTTTGGSLPSGGGTNGVRTVNLNVNGIRVASALYTDSDEIAGRMINMG